MNLDKYLYGPLKDAIIYLVVAYKQQLSIWWWYWPAFIGWMAGLIIGLIIGLLH